MQVAEGGGQIQVDLPSQTVTAGNHQFGFELDPFRKHCLLNGLDDIGLTMVKAPDIATYETGNRTAKPWLWGGKAQA